MEQTICFPLLMARGSFCRKAPARYANRQSEFAMDWPKSKCKKIIRKCLPCPSAPHFSGDNLDKQRSKAKFGFCAVHYIIPSKISLNDTNEECLVSIRKADLVSSVFGFSKQRRVNLANDNDLIILFD
jgi:hypothetical protein